MHHLIPDIRTNLEAGQDHYRLDARTRVPVRIRVSLDNVQMPSIAVSAVCL